MLLYHFVRVTLFFEKEEATENESDNVQIGDRDTYAHFFLRGGGGGGEGG